MSAPYTRPTRIALVAMAAILAGCAGPNPWLPGTGPTLSQTEEFARAQPAEGIQLVEIDDAVARRVQAAQKSGLFSTAWGQSQAPVFAIGPGDVVEVSVWEAPPASLFGSAVLDVRGGAGTSRVTTLPEQVVSSAGSINVPFAGAVRAAGRQPQEIEAEIVRLLTGKANQPQVMVRQVRNATSNVTVVGEVNTSTRMPLSAKGERLLDALAAAGGTRQPVGKMTLQVTRGTQVLALPLDRVIADPQQNIYLQPGDVVTAMHQPFSLTVLGATGKNDELNFEAQGISLAQALARAGGLQDQRANPGGVFVFRFEDPAALPPGPPRATTPEGLVPVVYQADLKNPAMFLVAQGFPMRNRDVIYVANAPAAELQKFLNLVSSVLVPALMVRNTSN